MSNKIKTFIKKPIRIKAIQFLGEEIGYGSIRGVKLPIEQRELEVWNKLHDSNLRVRYGEWLVVTDENDLYPMENDYLLYNHYEVTNE